MEGQKVILQHFAFAAANAPPFLKFAMSEDVRVWYVLLHDFAGNDDEFVGGEYLCKMMFPATYPYAPPLFEVLTPNGVYDIHKDVCISMGHYHPGNYAPRLGALGFAHQLAFGMIAWRSLGQGIALLSTSVEEKRRLAKVSAEYNAKNHAEKMAAFVE